MSTTIKYKICFHSYWHCGSGLSAGAGVDALTIKDKDGLPFVPGKTVKGLLREAVEELHAITMGEFEPDMDYLALFGMPNEAGKETHSSEAFFSNVELENNERNAIIANKVQEYLYKSISSTAIDENGIAKEHSLRKIEVVVPCTLHGTIYHVPESMAEELVKSFGFIKSMGLNRTRGLGRCTITKEEVES